MIRILRAMYSRSDSDENVHQDDQNSLNLREDKNEAAVR